MRRPVFNLFTLAAGAALIVALGVSAHAQGAHLFGSPASGIINSESSPSAEPSESPEASPSPEPSESPEPPEASPSPEPTEQPEAPDNEQGDDNDDQGEDTSGD